MNLQDYTISYHPAKGDDKSCAIIFKEETMIAEFYGEAAEYLNALKSALDEMTAKCVALQEAGKNLNRKMLQGCVECASCGRKCAQCCFDDQVINSPNFAIAELLADREIANKAREVIGDGYDTFGHELTKLVRASLEKNDGP